MNNKAAKTSLAMAFSVGAVLFSAHAGGGFATGNQAHNYFVGLGWSGIIGGILAMLLLSLAMYQGMVMYNSRGLKSYKELFETLFHPFDKLEILFEIFFYIMVLMAVSAAVSGAASTLNTYFGLNYYVGIFIVGTMVLMLTIFGEKVVRMASSYMTIIILVSAITMYITGIAKSEISIGDVLAASMADTGFANLPKAIINAFVYAGFQCVTMPTILACGTPIREKGGLSKSMIFAFVMNSVALTLSVIMLLSWNSYYTSVEGGTTIPTLTCCMAMGISWLAIVYGVCLLLCLLSTGVTTTFGFVARFEKLKLFSGIKSATARSAIVSAFVIILSMAVSLIGLTNIIKYGYGYCGYLGIFVIIIPMLTVGAYKNRKYLKEHNNEFAELETEE